MCTVTARKEDLFLAKRGVAAVCTENLLRVDLMRESLNVGHDGRAETPPPGRSTRTAPGRIRTSNQTVMSGRPGSTCVRSTGVARKSPGPTGANGGHTL
jgi:hypothetical protein